MTSTFLLYFAWLFALARPALSEPPALTPDSALLGAPGPVTEGGQPAHALAAQFAFMHDEALVKEARVSAQVVRLVDGDEVWALNADKALTPASVMKVLTSATALRTLGSSFRFTTTLLREGEVNSEGVLEGNLYVVGMGDPTMVVEKLWKLIRDLRTEGIVEVSGDVIFDDTYFDNRTQIVGWNNPVDLATGPAYFPPLSALSVNYNTTTLVVAPGPEVGGPARVELETGSATIEIENEVVTVPRNGRSYIKIEREVVGKNVKFKVQGSVPLNEKTQRYFRAIGDPTAHYISVFRNLLGDAGIDVTGKLHTGKLPRSGTEVVLEHLSPPLSEILNHTNKHSSNFMAEQVLKAVGAEAKGLPGSTAKGLEVVRAYLTELGIPTTEYDIVNGSGLARTSALKVEHVNAVLIDFFEHPMVGPEFRTSLAVSGVDGTLRRRWDGDEEKGRVRGKTGSLDEVYCLAGYATDAAGERYAFSIFINGHRRDRDAKALQDRFGEALLAVGTVQDLETRDPGAPTP